MSQTDNGHPEAGRFGVPAQQAGETCRQSTHAADTPAPDVPWIRRRSGDPVVIRRRIAAELDDLLGIFPLTGAAGLDYHAAGLDLGVPEREAAAPAPLVCAA